MSKLLLNSVCQVAFGKGIFVNLVKQRTQCFLSAPAALAVCRPVVYRQLGYFSRDGVPSQAGVCSRKHLDLTLIYKCTYYHRQYRLQPLSMR